MSDALNSNDGLDRSRLNEVTGGDPEFLREIIDAYLQDGEEQIAEIESAIEAGDTKGLEHRAHALKGSSANVGANAVTELASQLEQRSKSGIPDDAQVIFTALKDAFAKIKAAMIKLRPGT